MEQPEDAEPENPEPTDGEDVRAEASRAPRKVPKPKRLEDKWYMVGWQREPALQVTLADPHTRERGVRAGVTGRLTEKVDELLEKFGGGGAPVLAGAVPGKSITLLLDDPLPDGQQTVLPVEFTLDAAIKVQRLIELDGEELLREAVRIGANAVAYMEFTHLIETAGVDVQWSPREREPSVLPATRAAAQYASLNVEPELRESEMTLLGIFYRVIADPSKLEGSIGIKLAKGSQRPSWHRKSWANVLFNRPALEDTIKDGLIGEPVHARVRVIEPVPGTGLSTEPRHMELIEIERAPTPLSLDDLLTEEDDAEHDQG
jgi:hypothetical protein